VYIALGDSLAYGVGASDPAATAYVPMLHEALKQGPGCPGAAAPCDELQLVNLAEDGGTSTTLLDTQVPAAVEIIAARNGDNDRANDVTVITIDVGGNDIYKPLRDTCATGLSPECLQEIEQSFTAFGQNLTMAIGQLRQAAGPDTTIAVMTYFNSLIACERQAAAPAGDLVLEGAPDGTPGLNDLIRQIAAQFDAVVAETFGALGADDLVGGTDCLHPNDAGHAILATAFETAIAGSSATPVALSVGLARR
jgi:lysophospholipase L1-like esterase